MSNEWWTDGNDFYQGDMRHGDRAATEEELKNYQENLYDGISSQKIKGRCTVISKVVNNHINNIFTFEKSGDILPWHTHDENTVHTSLVTKGSFSLRTEKYTKIIKIGDPIIDWKPKEFHEFIALEDNSELLNIVKKPKVT